jgi:hypothetical protein
MATARSYLTPSAAAKANEAMRNTIATFTQLSPTTLTLVRNGAALPPQTVLMRYRQNRAPRLTDAGAAEAQQQDGTFTKVLPFDVAVGDVFTLAGGQRGTITMVPPAQNEIQRAEFTVDEGTA